MWVYNTCASTNMTDPRCRLNPDSLISMCDFIYFSAQELISTVDSSKHNVLHPLTLEVKATHALMCFSQAVLFFSAWVIHVRNIALMVSSLCFSFSSLLHCSEDAKRLRVLVLIRFAHTELIKIPDNSEVQDCFWDLLLKTLILFSLIALHYPKVPQCIFASF